jgi:GAF domain-containing protein
VQDDITMDVMRRGQVEVIDGWDARFSREIFEREGHAELVRAFVPVRLRDEPIGLIEAGYQRTARAQITPEEVRVLSGLADQMAIAIDNARLLEQVQASLGETERLYNASQQIFVAPDVTGMLAALAQHAPVADINRMVVWLFEFDAEHRVTALVTGATWYSGVGEPPPPVGTRLPPMAMRAFQFAQSRQAIITHDVEHDTRIDPGTVAALRQLRVRAVAILPLWASDRQVGMLMLQSEQPHTFVDAEVRPYTSLAQQMATAIENRRLFEQTQTALSETEQLYNVGLHINSAVTLEDLLQAAVAPSIATGASSAGLWLFELDNAEQPEHMEFTVSWSRDDRPPLPLGTRLRVAEFPSSQLWLNTSGEPSFIGNTAQDKRLDARLRATFQQLNIAATGFMPLLIGSRWIGLIIISWQEPHDFTLSEQRLYQSGASQVAVAVDNRRLLDRIRSDAERERTINRIASRIRNAQSVEQVLNIATQEVRAATRAAVSVAEIAPASPAANDLAPSGNGHAARGDA